MVGNMLAELSIAGFRMTVEEWESLDEESRELMRQTLAADAAAEEPYESYTLTLAQWDALDEHARARLRDRSPSHWLMEPNEEYESYELYFEPLEAARPAVYV